MPTSAPIVIDRSLRRRVGIAGCSALLFLSVLVLHGLVPGVLFPSLGTTFVSVALGESLAAGSLWQYPQHFGVPLGAPITTGLPFVYMEAILLKAFSLRGVDAFMIANWIFLGGAFLGARALFVYFKIGPILAAIGAALYLSSIFVVRHQGITSLMLAFALLPLSIWLDLKLRDAFFRRQEGPTSWRFPCLIIATGMFRVGLLFLDGYSFVISAVFAAVLVVFAIAVQPRMKWQCWLIYCLSILASLTVAYVCYRSYLPAGSDYRTMPVDFFRAQGVDLATLALPLDQSTQLASWCGLELPWTAYQFYGDGTNAFRNYLGVSLLLAVAGALLSWRKHPSLLPLVVAGSICLFASFGPSLKILDTRGAATPERGIVFSDYLMPAGEATLNLHTGAFYTGLPGVRAMRAVYRWLIGFKIVAVLLSIVCLAELFRRRQRALGGCLFCLLALDSISPVPKCVGLYSSFEKARNQFYAEAIPELAAVIPPGSLILFVSNENDYLAEPIAMALHVSTYNVGGDKNLEMAKLSWPEEVKSIRAKNNTINKARQLADRGRLDFLVFPHFNLRWDSYGWPPNSQHVEQAKSGASTVVAESNSADLSVRDGRYFTVVAFPRRGSERTPKNVQ